MLVLFNEKLTILKKSYINVKKYNVLFYFFEIYTFSKISKLILIRYMKDKEG